MHTGWHDEISDGYSYKLSRRPPSDSMAGRCVQEGAVYSDATGDLPPRKSEKTRVKETLEKIAQLKTRFLLTLINWVFLSLHCRTTKIFDESSYGWAGEDCTLYLMFKCKTIPDVFFLIFMNFFHFSGCSRMWCVC